MIKSQISNLPAYAKVSAGQAKVKNTNQKSKMTVELSSWSGALNRMFQGGAIGFPPESSAQTDVRQANLRKEKFLI